MSVTVRKLRCDIRISIDKLLTGLRPCESARPIGRIVVGRTKRHVAALSAFQVGVMELIGHDGFKAGDDLIQRMLIPSQQMLTHSRLG